MTDICRMLLGADGHGAQGVFATLPGFDARTADPGDNLKWSFRSDWPRVENLHQVGRVTGLSNASDFAVGIDFPLLPYVPFVSVRYERTAGTMQDDPWCKGSYVEQSYFTPYRVRVWTSGFAIGFPIGSSQLAVAPIPPTSAVYFVWKIPAGVPT